MIKNTYGKTGGECQYRMATPLATLAGFYRLKGEARKAAETFLMMFNVLKGCDAMFSSMVIIQAINTYLEANMTKEAKATLKIANDFFVGSMEYLNYAYDINSFRLP